jgi:molecular chaperone DnaK (HSP70)
MALSGTGAWLVANRTDTVESVSGTIVHAAADPAPDAQFVSTSIQPDPAFHSTVDELERTLRQNSAQLDPATVEVLERSIAAIDAAIEESRAALAADPANETLHRQLENAMQKKIDLLRRANRIQRAGT